MGRCNPYGWENPNGPNPAGGLLADSHTVDDSKRWHCGAQADHRFRWVCSHDNLPPGSELTIPFPRINIRSLEDGHTSGEPVELCEYHAKLLKWRVGAQLVPCPRCVARGPDHKCWLTLVAIS